MFVLVVLVASVALSIDGSHFFGDVAALVCSSFEVLA
jgi:hypothetical protein